MEENITTHPRRKAREATMQALYALEINNGFPQDVLALCNDSFNNSENDIYTSCLLYTSPSPRDLSTSRMPSSA